MTGTVLNKLTIKLLTPLLSVGALLFTQCILATTPSSPPKQVNSKGYAYSTIPSSATVQARSLSAKAATASGVTAKHTLHDDKPPHAQAWVYESWLELIGDSDQDGLYSEFALTVDIDTHSFERNIIVDVSLIDDWEETTLIFTSDPFTLFNTHDTDALRVESTLAQGFLPDDYRLLISIYDADTLEWLADYTLHDGTSDITIPLESQEHDVIFTEIVVDTTTSGYSETTVVTEQVEVHHAGTFSWGTLMVFSAIGLISFGYRVYQACSSLFRNRPKIIDHQLR